MMDSTNASDRGHKVGTERAKRLTPKQKAFADNILSGKNQTNAFLDAYGHKDKPRKYGTHKGYELMKQQKIKKYLTINGFGAATRVVKISKNAKDESVKLRANLEILDRVMPKMPVTAIQINFGKNEYEV